MMCCVVPNNCSPSSSRPQKQSQIKYPNLPSSHTPKLQLSAQRRASTLSTHHRSPLTSSLSQLSHSRSCCSTLSHQAVMAAISNSLATLCKSPVQLSYGSSFKPASDQYNFGGFRSTQVSLPSIRSAKTARKPLVVLATRSDGEGSSNAGLIIGGFVLGGIIVGAIACVVFENQITLALARKDRRENLRKLPKFIYDEEKTMEKTKKILIDKIAKLNAAIDAAGGSNGVAATSDEAEAAM